MTGPHAHTVTAPTIDEITLADRPDGWAALGFDVAGDVCQLGAVRLRFVEPQQGGQERAGILGWSLRDVRSAALSAEGELPLRGGCDGLATTVSHTPVPADAPAHPNGVLAIDHVVVMTPALDRTVAALRAAGLDLRRIREQPTPAGAPRQAFFRLGREILEVVQEPAEIVARDGGPRRPAHFWGLALLVEDIQRTAESLAPHVSEVRAAVQPGRRIATVRRSAGLAVPLALMSAAERPDAGRTEVHA